MSSAAAPLECVWTGDEFRPISSWWVARARRQFTVGEVYNLVDQPERSSASHRHYFAALKNAFESLPPLMAERFASVEAMRKYCLIKAGYCDTTTMPCGSPDMARRFAALARPLDAFAIVTVKGSVVTVYRAKSQSMRDMSKADFQASKERVLEIAADLLDVAKSELSNSDKAAA